MRLTSEKKVKLTHSLIAFPNCKVNLGLLIKNKRTDGYHNIETIFYPLPFYDVLEIIESKSTFHFTSTGTDSGSPINNLCVKAYELLKRDFSQLPEVTMHLHKTIPAGAGLGGGSSDAAFTLGILNQKFSLGISVEKLYDYALRLGSDCPFFILNKPCLATGRGEIIEEIPLSLKGFFLKIVIPPTHISTKEIFKQVIPDNHSSSLKAVSLLPVDEWKHALRNDFEKIVFFKYPEIGKVKKQMYHEGAVYAAMSGTGSAVFGIFKEKPESPKPYPTDYLERWLELK